MRFPTDFTGHFTWWAYFSSILESKTSDNPSSIACPCGVYSKVADQIVFSITFKNGLSETHHSIDDHPDVQISRENVRSVSCYFVSARYFLVHSAKNIEKNLSKKNSRKSEAPRKIRKCALARVDKTYCFSEWAHLENWPKYSVFGRR